MSDLNQLPVVCVGKEDEHGIADAAEKASALLSEADLLERVVAGGAEALTGRFLAGDSAAFVLGLTAGPPT